MKDEGGSYNLYGYEPPVAGDWSYWDAAARNPSPRARDFWLIPAGNNTVSMTEVDADDTGEQELASLKLDGASDHGVSEALYLHDPDGNGIELYWDRPEADWPRDDEGALQMVTRPLDLDDLLAAE